MIKNKILTIVFTALMLIACDSNLKQEKINSVKKTKLWTTEQANNWYAQQPFLVGGNYVPVSAINQLEMWQEDTFDPKRIDFELEKAAQIGLNTMRVYLHDLAWKQDPMGFFKRVDKFLEISAKHEIKIMFVIFDGVWNPYPKAGKQPEPVPHVHNSGWVQSPGREILEDPKKQDELKAYVQQVISRYKNDTRVLIWDLFNEPDNASVGNFGGDSDVPEMPAEQKKATALALLKKTFVWAREIGPSQPLTVGVWGNPTWIEAPDAIETFSLENSDVISFHSYSDPEATIEMVEGLKKYNRPLICTEYMARGNKSTFEGILPIFHKNKVAAYHWGLFNGKSQTIYPWSSWKKKFTAEPELWHHDVFRKDGTPFDSKETELIKELTSASNKAITGGVDAPSVKQESFGTLGNGTPISIYKLKNINGLEAHITNYGGILVSLLVPDNKGKFDDIVLGYDDLSSFVADSSFQGPLIGRFGNRIAKGSFTINDTKYQLANNNDTNHLHGGVKGFGKHVWQAESFTTAKSSGVVLSRLSHDGEEGYPGNLMIKAVYELSNDNQLSLTFTATTDAATPVNLTQHAYYNLSGGGSILNHKLTIPASRYTPVDETSIPLGKNVLVSNTPFDFTKSKTIGKDIDTPNQQITYGKGYDHNWVLDKPYGQLGLAVRVEEASSGRVMEIYTTEPGLQFYSGNFLDGSIKGKNGRTYQHRTAIVLEPQHFPDSPNQQAFPSTILQPGETYRNEIIYKFSLL
ncbi:MAG: galactose-1-epimerase [Colwellia sp.]|nr:galactose-1-epimerase [Colwellia sp.]